MDPHRLTPRFIPGQPPHTVGSGSLGPRKWQGVVLRALWGRLPVCTFGNKGARPAQRRGATGCGVAAKKGLRLVHEEALALLQWGGLHGQEGGILKFRVGAGDGAWAEWAGAHWESQFVGVQLWEGTTRRMCLIIYLKII